MKFKQKKTSNTTLSEKIADALTVKPKADIEDDQVFGTKPQTVSRADFSSSDSEDETTISAFRKRNINLLSEISRKYEGKVISKKDLDKESNADSIESGSEGGSNASSDESFNEANLDKVNIFKQLTKVEDSSPSEDDNTIGKNKIQARTKKQLDSEVSESDSEGESDDYSITQFKKQIGSDDSEGGTDDEDDDVDGEGYDISQIEEPLKENFEHVKKQNISEDAKKGACVRNQLLIWENLLEMRIHLQRCMNSANQMPLPNTHADLKKNNDFVEECNTTKTNVVNVLDKFLNLQSMLFKNFPETKTFSSKQNVSKAKETKKDESDEEIPSDTENEEIPSDTDQEEEAVQESKKSSKKSDNTIMAKKRKLEDYEKDLSTTHKAFKQFQDTTIQKWSDKTRLATATNVKKGPSNTILQQISYILSDREKLLRRTQLKRSDYDIVGYNKPVEEVNEVQNGEINPVIRDRKDNDEYIPEIFDDSDFYHQLLRELIECKSADISDPVQLSRQWIALQQMRSKMKRKVDTKATKGRRIKYVVHNKLVNYMAPEKCTTWNDESTNELYSSLFGKMFEQNNLGVNGNMKCF